MVGRTGEFSSDVRHTWPEKEIGAKAPWGVREGVGVNDGADDTSENVPLDVLHFARIQKYFSNCFKFSRIFFNFFENHLFCPISFHCPTQFPTKKLSKKRNFKNFN